MAAENQALSEVENSGPLSIAFAKKSSSKQSEGKAIFEEIARTDIILAANINEHSTAQLKFTWRDQGYGNKKGKLRVRLLDAVTDAQVASSPEYFLDTHDETVVTESFGPNHDLVREFAKG